MYYWAVSITGIGHLSLRIIEFGDEPETYISHWPKDRWNILGKGSNQMRTFLHDCVAEGRFPDEMVMISEDKVKIELMKRWWRNFVNDTKSGKQEYNLFTNNCAQVVYKALRAGWFPRYFVFYEPVMAPGEVNQWVKFQNLTR